MRNRTTIAGSPDAPERRAGQITWVLLMVLVVTFFFGILVVNTYFVNAVRVQQLNATDSAALAGAELLADEALLFGDPAIFALNSTGGTPPSLLNLATSAAIEFGKKNFVDGKSFDVRTEDVFFDIIDLPNRKIIGTLPADPKALVESCTPQTLAQLRTINSVQVVGRSLKSRDNALRLPIRAFFSPEMIARSEAVLDGYVFGFHTDPLGAIKIPMAPVALRADIWREQVEQLVDPTLATPTDGPLPYRDLTINLAAPAYDPDGATQKIPARLLYIGASTKTEVLSQFDPVNPGITPAQYGNYLANSGQKMFGLDPKTLQLSVPAGPWDDADLGKTGIPLKQILGKRLVWPLFSGYDGGEKAGNVIVTGFVAARVTDVNSVIYSIVLDNSGKAVPGTKFKGTCAENKKPLGTGETCVEYTVVQLTLRPTMLATSTGVVFVKDWPTGPQHQLRFPNAYVKRIRLMK